MFVSDAAIHFLKAYAQEIGFDSCKEVVVHPGRTVLILTYLGQSPQKPAILLNSHTDVVPADYVSAVLSCAWFRQPCSCLASRAAGSAIPSKASDTKTATSTAVVSKT